MSRHMELARLFRQMSWNILRPLLVVSIAALTVAGAHAQDPVGLWRTIDDETGKERSFIRITEVNGELVGIVERIIERPGDDASHLCKKCEGEHKDKPIVGMKVMWGLKKKSDTKFDGGQILDPNNGKTYRCKLAVIEQGKKLDVRGYIGISLIGRSQIWLREP